MNIYQKMSAITAKIEAVAKNLSVGYGQNKYNAVGEADVLKAVKPIEKEYGVYSYPSSRRVIESGELENVKNDDTISKQLYLRIETTYRFVNTDDPKEFIEITTYGDGVDTQDKAPGKAMTYGDKYALLKAYKIITGDDPDQKASEPYDTAKVNHKPETPKDRFEAAYPSRDDMISMIKTKVPEASIKKTLEAKGLSDITELSNAAIAWWYNKVSA